MNCGCWPPGRSPSRSRSATSRLKWLPTGELSAGEVGYVATGLKTVRECRVGDTITLASDVRARALPGYQHPKPMVFAGFYPVEGEDYADLKDALEKLQLNDASLVYQPETSQALNFGFRCGFLGMFHMDIVQERLEREHGLDIIATAPSVEYELALIDGSIQTIDSPAELPDPGRILEVREPWMRIQIFTPDEFYGTVMDLAIKRRAAFIEQEYPAPRRVVLHFDIPLAETDRRLLRPAEVAHPRLRLARLPVQRLPGRRSGETRNPDQRGAGGRPGHDRPPRRRLPQGPGASSPSSRS